MNERNQERINDFLFTLERALGHPGEQSGGLLEEVRADFDEHVKHFQAAGHSEDEAVEQALAEMGNPYELAHHVRHEVPPFGGKVVTGIRYVAAFGVLVWTLLLMWLFRGGTYGVSGLAVLAGVLLFHLPVILLLWPRIVWRRNWLFGLIPAGLAFLAAIVLAAGGRESSEQILMPRTEEEAADFRQQLEAQEAAASGNLQVSGILVFSTAGILTIVLLIAIQQSSQRRTVLLVTGLTIALFEIPFQLEELVFRQDREKVRAYFKAELEESGAYPTEENFKTHGPRIRGEHARVSIAQQDFSLFWNRPLRPGHAILYSSEDNRVRIQD